MLPLLIGLGILVWFVAFISHLEATDPNRELRREIRARKRRERQLNRVHSQPGCRCRYRQRPRVHCRNKRERALDEKQAKREKRRAARRPPIVNQPAWINRKRSPLPPTLFIPYCVCPNCRVEALHWLGESGPASSTSENDVARTCRSCEHIWGQDVGLPKPDWNLISAVASIEKKDLVPLAVSIEEGMKRDIIAALEEQGWGNDPLRRETACRLVETEGAAKEATKGKPSWCRIHKRWEYPGDMERTWAEQRETKTCKNDRQACRTVPGFSGKCVIHQRTKRGVVHQLPPIGMA
jgi:hypothetical protein